NPFDLFRLDGSTAESDAEMLAELLAGTECFSDDPYWDISGKALNSGLIAHIEESEPPEKRNLVTLREWLNHDDLDYLLAVKLDEKKVRSRMARQEIVSYLALPSDR